MKRRTTQELTALAREVPWRELDEPAVERVRAQLRQVALAAPPERGVFRDHRRVIAAAVSAAAAVAVAIVWGIGFEGRTAEVRSAATAIAEPEIMRLTDGYIQVRAAERGGRSMRIVVGDAEIEARAADFEVFAQDDRVIAVFAASGMVEVKRFGAAPMILQPGVRWVAQKQGAVEGELPQKVEPAQKAEPAQKVESVGRARARVKRAPPVAEERAVIEQPAAPVIEQPAAPAIEEPAAPAIEPAQTSTATETPPIAALPEPKDVPVHRPAPIAAPEVEGDELYFRRGWTAYRAGLHAEAAQHFARVDPRGPWGEDAAYWHIHAELRIKDELAVTPRMRAFIESYPKSARRGELAVMLGWILVREDRNHEARKLFKLAFEDPSAAVRESARLGYIEADED